MENVPTAMHPCIKPHDHLQHPSQYSLPGDAYDAQDADLNNNFLRRFFRDKDPEHVILIWTMSKDKQHKASYWFTDIEKAISFATGTVVEQHDMYFGLGLAPRVGSKFKRCEAREIIALLGFWADIDIKGPHHVQDHLPPTIDDALAFLHETPLEPSYIVNSGGGLHVYWQFAEPWILDTDTERAKAAQGMADWLDTTLPYQRLGFIDVW